MKNIQFRYTLLQILYWLSSCALQGYVAILLLSKGLSNTEIGIVTGVSCVLTIFLSPVISSLPEKFEWLSGKKLLVGIMGLSSVFFLLLCFVPMNVVIIMILYIAAICIFVSAVPFLSIMATDYIRKGYSLNFGLARGIGSVSYATAAVVIAQFVNLFSPDFLAVIYAVSGILFTLVISGMELEVKQETEESEKIGFPALIKKYKVLFLVLLGYSFCFAGTVTIGTYLIHIVNRLGGDTTIYSIAVFIMAVSEMPAMSVTRKLMRKFKTMDLVIVAGICYLFRNIGICIAPHIFVVFIAMLFQSITYGLLTSLLTYYVSDTCEPQDEMKGQTLIAIMTTGIGSTLGNVVGGILQDTLGIQAMFTFVIILTVMGTCVMVATGLKYRKTEA